MKRLRLIQLIRSTSLKRQTIHSILEKDPSLIKLSTFTSTKISDYFSLPTKIAHHIYNGLRNSTVQKEIEADQKLCKIITLFDKTYPSLLKVIKDPPLILYAIGDVSLLRDSPAISVIGTRNPSSEAWNKLNHVVTPLIKDGWIIVSGLAKGIDSFAHKLTLNNRGKTISVLGNGFNYVYPKENTGLLNLIKSRGIVITEYPPDTPPRRYQFPERNRIISGLSMATLVIEAREKSGTLITVNQALDQGRDVYAVPGSPLLPETKGCHKMIQDGAKLVTSADDILEDWDKNRQLSYQF